MPRTGRAGTGAVKGASSAQSKEASISSAQSRLGASAMGMSHKSSSTSAPPLTFWGQLLLGGPTSPRTWHLFCFLSLSSLDASTEGLLPLACCRCCFCWAFLPGFPFGFWRGPGATAGVFVWGCWPCAPSLWLILFPRPRPRPGPLPDLPLPLPPPPRAPLPRPVSASPLCPIAARPPQAAPPRAHACSMRTPVSRQPSIW